MIDKEYLDKLKKEDYITWYELVNDPMVVGQDSDSLCLPITVIVTAIGILFCIVMILF